MQPAADIEVMHTSLGRRTQNRLQQMCTLQKPEVKSASGSKLVWQGLRSELMAAGIAFVIGRTNTTVMPPVCVRMCPRSALPPIIMTARCPPSPASRARARPSVLGLRRDAARRFRTGLALGYRILFI